MKKISFLVVIFYFIIMPYGCSSGDGDGTPPGPYSLAGEYLLAFHACDISASDCNDPREHMTYIAVSDDGENWSILPDYTPHKGSVPDVIRREDTLYVYTPGKLRRYFIDKNSWEDPVNVSIKHGDGADEMFVDPSPILDDSGSIVLFYLVGQSAGDPAGCQEGESTCTKYFRSATEEEGSDGSLFIVDDGNRAEVSITAKLPVPPPLKRSFAFTPQTASDPDIFEDPNGFVLLISLGQNVKALTSSSLRGSYAEIQGLTDGLLVSDSGGIPAGHYDSKTGRYWIYVHKPEGQNLQVIKRAETDSIAALIPDSAFTTIITGETFPEIGASYTVASPGFAVNEK